VAFSPSIDQNELAQKDDQDFEPERSSFQRILVGVDTTAHTTHVIQAAASLSRALGAKVLVCTVANIPTGVQGNDVDGFPANDKERSTLEKVKEIVHSEFKNGAESVEIKILHGDPAERICEYAEYSDCGLVVVGSTEQGSLKKALLGSVSASVASRCKRSVLIVR
jgi:nucleotide-binding universal stress UspA family protein